MIQNIKLQQLNERSLANFREQKANIHPDRYAIMTEPILKDLQALRQEIADCENSK